MKPIMLVCLFALLHTTRADVSYIHNDTNSLILVDSFTDENGFYEYTLLSTSTNFVFSDCTFDLNVGEVESISLSSGWNHSQQAGQLRIEGGFSPEETSLTLSFQSASTNVHFLETILSGEVLDIYGIASTPGIGGSVTSANIVGYTKFNYLSPIPEPSTAILFLGSGAGLLLWKRRKQRTSRRRTNSRADHLTLG
ncbi:PEP-CTERM sorting domain-containing protein [Pontiellaceae bacterium B12227]|nr:PEP-CTERM sorting domain-containing protein [Pontiellaceae bacterium B12227]